MPDSLTMTPAAGELAREAVALLEDAKGLTIVQPDQYEYAATLLRYVRGKKKELEEERMAQTRPLDKQKAEIIALYGQPLTVLLQADRVIEDALKKYRAVEAERQRVAQLAAQRKADQEEARLRERARKAEEARHFDKADELERKAEMVVPAVVERETPKVEGISARKVWKFEIVDEEKLPRQFLVPNEGVIGRTVRAQGKMAESMIPGIRVWAEETITARSAR